MYSERFWKKNWDPGLDDLAPEEFETTYVEMVRETFQAFPDKTAFGFLGMEMTFRELDSYAGRFAGMLMENGFEKGDVVGINLPNIPEYPISIIGALRAGCVVSGVSPLLSADQIKYQLNDLASQGKRTALVTLDAVFEGQIAKIAPDMPGVELIVATGVLGFLPRWKQTLARVLKKVPSGKIGPLSGKKVLDFHKDVLGGRFAPAPDVKTAPDDLGWIYYTGGTTGPAKGAMLTQRNVAHNIMALSRWLGWEKGKGTLVSGFPMFHVAGTAVCQCALYFGWTQALIPNPRDTGHICREIKKYRPSVMVNVPSLYQILMADETFRALDHSALETCLSAAAPFPLESQKELEEVIGKGKILELYGMTETSPVSAMNPSLGVKKLGSVGMPFLNTECKLADPSTGEEVPLGEPGEICMKGPLVMKGYLNKPEETQNAIDKDGYMRTGDVGIMDSDGYIRIVDRTKDMIIVGGFKVFSSKVEETLSGHPGAAMTALIGVENPDRPGSEFVKAFVQPAPSFTGDENDLKDDILRYAGETLAAYETPKLIEIVDEIPLTAVGKIDKKVLRAMEKDRT